MIPETRTPSPLATRLGWVLERGLGYIAGVALMLMMFITSADVIARYWFNKPLKGAFELTEILLVLLIYLGLPLVSYKREHVVIDVLEAYMPPLLKKILGCLAQIICVLAFSGMAWVIFKRALRVAGYGDTTSLLKIPLAPIAYGIGVLLVVSAVIHIILIVQDATSIPSENTPPPS